MTQLKKITLTDTDDDNTAIFYLTDAGDVVSQCNDFDDPAYEIVTHGMYVGSHDNWMEWIKSQLIDLGYYVYQDSI